MFPIQSKKYQAGEVRNLIEDMDAELQDETDLAKTLDSSAIDNLAEAKNFMQDDNIATIKKQLELVRALNKNIREAVASNDMLSAADKEYSDFVNSQPCVDIANNIAEIYATLNDLDAFLTQKGRRGRPSH